MKIPSLNIGGLIAKVPIIQGGMGIGVSGYKLAGAVAAQGAIGVIAGVNIGYREPDFITNTLKANLRAIKSEISKARAIAPNGIIGVNFLVAMNHYNEMVRAAVEEGVDLIISGAGLPTNLPELVKGFKTRIAPIVSSGKAAKVVLKYWDTRYERTADAVIVEGPEAGGHLGFSEETLHDANRQGVLEITKEVIEVVKQYEDKFEKKIPVITAGGVYTGEDIANCLKIGAGGVQMSTRFVATDECDADIRFKQEYSKATKDDVVIINSPVGMPGRALKNKFIEQVETYGDEITGCSLCLKGCNPKVAPYCISKALINAVTGNVDDGLVFVGSNVYRVDKIIPVKDLLDELVHDTELSLEKAASLS